MLKEAPPITANTAIKIDTEERLTEILLGNSLEVYTSENTTGKITIEINF